MVADEGELRGLQHHAAIGLREAAGTGPRHDHPPNRELSFGHLVAGLEIDRAGKALDFGCDGADRLLLRLP